MNNTTHISFYLRLNTLYVFSKDLQAMGKPAFIRLLINPDTKQMVLQPYNKLHFCSFRVPKDIYLPQHSKETMMRICSQPLCKMLARQFQWDEEASYRIPGTIYKKQRIVLFDLEKADAIPPAAKQKLVK